MAYEEMTYEVILQRMIDRVVAQDPNLDIREGSIIFNALAPAATELAIAYIELDNALQESFVNTASREYLLIGCEQMGMDVSVFEATNGIHELRFNVEVPIGSRWNYDEHNYTVMEDMGITDDLYCYRAYCETSGTEPNTMTGDLTPITDAPVDLVTAELVRCLIEGKDETPDDDVRIAYYEYLNSTVTDGNVNQYERWCSEYDGIGNSKIFPLWKGANTVKVSILSESNRAASTELVKEFQEYLDPGAKGMGDGVAPIGAFVTVGTAEEVPLNISATVTLKSGYTSTDEIATALTDYFADIAYDKMQVSYMTIGATILGVEGVESINNLLVNGGTSDINLTDEQIPVLGTTNWTV
jgi:uncharacterized phage protein gp47/JayE